MNSDDKTEHNLIAIVILLCILIGLAAAWLLFPEEIQSL